MGISEQQLGDQLLGCIDYDHTTPALPKCSAAHHQPMNLTHHFLISMPQMQDTDFRNSLVYILDHGEHGALGVIVNQKMRMPLGELLAQLSIADVETSIAENNVLRGGPVDQEHGLVLHKPGPQFEFTRNFKGGVSLSSSRDILAAIARGNEPEEYLVLLGHAGWASNQLEMEVANNAWLTCEASTDILFSTPLEQRRQAVGDILGIDLMNLTVHSGHA